MSRKRYPSLSQLDAEQLFGNELLSKQLYGHLLYGTNIDSIGQNTDPETTYKLNLHGYRGPNLRSVDFVALGCSQTFGQGVEEEDTWPSRLSKLTGMSYVNMGVPAESSHGMLNHALAYIDKFGAPKAIVALFPGYGRFSTILNYAYNRQRLTEPPYAGGVSLVRLNTDAREDAEIPKLSKRPYPIEDIISVETTMYQSLQAIKMLIEYCKVAGIKLLFSSWQEEMVPVMETIGYSEYVKTLPRCYEGVIFEDCHSDERKIHESRWHEGSDVSGHMGVHAHIHYAEAFAERLKNEQ